MTASRSRQLRGADIRQEVGLRGWVELVVIALFYGTYSWIRNQFGSGGAASVETARANAQTIIDLEQRMGLLIEDDVQAWFVDWTVFIQFWNLFYGFFHFAVTAAVLVFLYFWRPRAYAFWRTAGLLATGLALVGFALFPLMPPRLLPNCGPFGACEAAGDVGPFIDTVVDIGGIWSFESGGMAELSNQFAAMPSLHIGWAAWCACVLARHLRRPLARAAALAYPWATLFAIIVTANHWWMDAVGGALVVLVGLVGAELGHRAVNRVRSRPIVEGDAARTDYVTR